MFISAVSSGMTVQEHSGNEKSCLWHATDFSDGELKDELFCIRFASIESKFASRILVFLIPGILVSTRSNVVTFVLFKS